MRHATPPPGTDIAREDGAPTGRGEPAPAGRPDGGRRRPVALIVALAVAVAVIVALVVALALSGDDDDTVTDPTTTETPVTTEPDTTEPDTTAPPTTPVPGPVDASTAVFPDATSDVRFDDPVDAARAFAVDFLGFTEPVVGEFLQGDSRSGEVEVRPVADGPVTTVIVRQLGPDDTWWVLGAATANITVDTPAANATITAPVTVTGGALAFEGTVDVEVRQDGAREPIGTGFVTGGGDVMRPFTGQVDFSPPSATYGALVLATHSAMDGQVWEAAVVRVQLG